MHLLENLTGPFVFHVVNVDDLSRQPLEETDGSNGCWCRVNSKKTPIFVVGCLSSATHATAPIIQCASSSLLYRVSYHPAIKN